VRREAEEVLRFLDTRVVKLPAGGPAPWEGCDCEACACGEGGDGPEEDYAVASLQDALEELLALKDEAVAVQDFDAACRWRDAAGGVGRVLEGLGVGREGE
jgi:hypothetical protein